MRKGMSDLEAVLRRAPVLGVVVLLAGVLGGCAGGPLRPGLQSPPATPTQALSPLGTPTAPPKPTWTLSPTRPPTRTPLPTFTPAPPTATPEPLPTLIPGLQTFIYATTGANYSEIYRVQGDATGRIQGSLYRVNTPNLWHSRIFLQGLFPSPDGTRVAVAWGYGEGGPSISILNVNDGILTPLFGETAQIDQRAIFLDWKPDGSSVLVLGGIGNPTLGGSLWLVNTSTHAYSPVHITQPKDRQEITSASFSPDGGSLVYARTACFQCGSEIWRSALDGSDQQLLFTDPEFRVQHVAWSPDGNLVAFTRWRESSGITSAQGELWVMATDGSAGRLLSPALTGYYIQFGPAWSPDSQQIAFIRADSAIGEPYGNIYVVNALSGEVRPLTRFQSAHLLEPIWSPDGTRIAFVASLSDSSDRFEPWVVQADGGDLHRLDESRTLMIDTRACSPMIVWLP